jgi:neutral ceramidase
MRKFFIFFAFLVILIVIFAFFLVEKIDRTPFQQTEHYEKWQKLAAELRLRESEGQFSAGWSKINITPVIPGPLAGYGSRRGKAFESVHDSVFVRVLALKNNQQTLYFLAADLLIIPPNVLEKLKPILANQNLAFSQIHFSATHTHNSLGGWGNSLTGRLFAGFYDPSVELTLAQKMADAIKMATSDMKLCKAFYDESIDNEDIKNRLTISDGQVDNQARALIFERMDGTTAHLLTYSAHATVLNSATFAISRDYPGVLVDTLEQNSSSFGIFMAGAVGSMGPIEKGRNDFDEVNNQAVGVFRHLDFSDKIELKSSLVSQYVKLPMNHPSARISKNFALRSWAFRYLFGDYPTFIKITKIGNTLILGMPCDFSGELMIELDAYAKARGINLMVTSFNGSYIGYVTHDRLYDRDLYETQTMAWYGYQNGAYFTQIVKDLVDKCR